MTLLTAHDLQLRLSDRAILTDISHDFGAGQVVGLLGPNGAGKTSLLRVLAGLMRPTAGYVLLHGQEVHAQGAAALAGRRAFVPQRPPSQAPFTVGDMVAMGCAHQNRFFSWSKKDVAVIEAALQEVGCTCPHLRLFSLLSAGEQQQVMVARAFAQDAKVILLDEPFANLDLRHKAQMMRALRCRSQAGTLVVVSLHDLNAARLFCNEIVLLQQGKIFARGRADDVLCRDVLETVYEVQLQVAQTAYIDVRL